MSRDPSPPSVSSLPPPLPASAAWTDHRALPSALTRGNYVVAHWRGHLPLPYAFWINGVLLSFIKAFSSFYLRGGLRAADASLTTVTMTVAAYALLSLGISVWQIVGIWRAAHRQDSRWTIAAYLALSLAALFALGMAGWNAYVVQILAAGAREQRRFNVYRVDVDVPHQAITTHGAMGVGYAQAVIDALERNPQIHYLHLNSHGGDVDNGLLLHDYLATHPQVIVQVDTFCASACTLAFIGAEQRLLAPQAALGYHQMRSIIDSTFSAIYVEGIQDKFKRFMQQRGATPGFIQQAFARQGNDVYVPDIDELFANHMITGVIVGSRIYDAPSWASAQFVERYRGDPQTAAIAELLDLIKQWQPGLYQRWLARSRATAKRASQKERSEGYADALGDLLRDARSQGMREASPAAVRAFASMYRKQLVLLRDRVSPAACSNYLTGTGISLGDSEGDFHRLSLAAFQSLLHGQHSAVVTSPDPVMSEGQLLHLRAAAIVNARAETRRDPQALVCHASIALLDQLLAIPPPRGDAMIKQYFRAHARWPALTKTTARN